MEWRDIEGYEGLYQVSDCGDVRSLDRVTTGKRKRKIKGKLIVKTKTSTGYWKVDLCKDGKVSHKKVHRLVATAFIQNPHDKPNVNHIDNNPLNNNVENLEWFTQSENVKHAYNIGAHAGRRNPTVLSKEMLKYISDLYVPYSREWGVRAMSKKLGIKSSTIYSAMRDRRNYLD